MTDTDDEFDYSGGDPLNGTEAPTQIVEGLEFFWDGRRWRQAVVLGEPSRVVH
jgi:hypothetical protein